MQSPHVAKHVQGVATPCTTVVLYYLRKRVPDSTIGPEAVFSSAPTSIRIKSTLCPKQYHHLPPFIFFLLTAYNPREKT